jgi:hypothetical protein
VRDSHEIGRCRRGRVEARRCPAGLPRRVASGGVV